MDIQAFRRQHRLIIDKASLLGGLCRHIKTREDAQAARDLIQAVDSELIVHLAAEDSELYPFLLSARDEGIRLLGAEAVEGVGGLSEIWVQFRDHWTVDAMAADPSRFALATAGVMNALSVRVAMEEDSLYPAAEAAARRGSRIMDAD